MLKKHVILTKVAKKRNDCYSGQIFLKKAVVVSDGDSIQDYFLNNRRLMAVRDECQ